MTVLDILKIVPDNQSTIIDVYVNGNLNYCSVMANTDEPSGLIAALPSNVLGLPVTEIKAKSWQDPILKKDLVSLSIVSEN